MKPDHAFRRTTVTLFLDGGTASIVILRYVFLGRARALSADALGRGRALR